MDWENVFVDVLKSGEIPGGIILLFIFTFSAVIIPFYSKQIKPMIDKSKEDKEQKENERLQSIADEREFRETVRSAIGQIPVLSEKIETLSSDVTSVQHIRLDMVDLNEKIRNMETRSNGEDSSIRDSLQSTQDLVLDMFKKIDSLDTKFTGIDSKVDTIIEGNTDEFRVYLLTLYDTHVMKEVPVEVSAVPVMSIRFKTYKKEGGNGWAEKMYLKLMKCKTTDGRTVSDIIEENTESQRGSGMS